MMFPVLSVNAPRNVTLSMALVGGVSEVAIGACIGLSLSIFMMGVEAAGRLVGQQAGLALGQVFDPTQNRQVSIIGQVYTISLTMLFLMVGGHRATIAALLDTYEAIPLLSFQYGTSVGLLLAEMLTASFILAIRVAGPALLALFLVGTALTFLSRTMPQLNILTVGFTIRALVALAVAGTALAAGQGILTDAIWDALETIRVAFGLDPGTLRLTN